MDHSDLPEAARDLIAAAELEAESILESYRENAKEFSAEAYRSGVDPTGLGFSPGSIALDLAREQEREGRSHAALYLLEATAPIYWAHLKPDMEAFTAKLDTIWSWASQKFSTKIDLGDTLKRDWRAWALRERSAGTASSKVASATDAKSVGEDAPPVLPVPPSSANSGNGALVDAFLLNCTQQTPLTANRSHIWRAVGHTTARQFQYWQAGSDRATTEDDRNFRRILGMKPAAFVALLKDKGIISAKV